MTNSYFTDLSKWNVDTWLIPENHNMVVLSDNQFKVLNNQNSLVVIISLCEIRSSKLLGLYFSTLKKKCYNIKCQSDIPPNLQRTQNVNFNPCTCTVWFCTSILLVLQSPDLFQLHCNSVNPSSNVWCLAFTSQDVLPKYLSPGLYVLLL